MRSSVPRSERIPLPLIVQTKSRAAIPGRAEAGRRTRVEFAARDARAVVLAVAGVLIFSDVDAVAVAGFTATVAMLFAVGFVERRVRAVRWAAILVVSAFVADFLWQIDWEPFNRSDEWESLPQTSFVLIALPVPMAVIAVGVGAGAVWSRVRSKPKGS
jgi:hypothetical protein